MQPPPENLERFWSGFYAKYPSKDFSILPEKPYARKVLHKLKELSDLTSRREAHHPGVSEGQSKLSRCSAQYRMGPEEGEKVLFEAWKSQKRLRSKICGESGGKVR